MKKAILLSLIILWSGMAQAYRLTCGWVLTEDIGIYERTDSPQRLQAAIESYKKIMHMTEFNHKPPSMDAARLRLRQMAPAEKVELLNLVKEYYNEVKALKYNKDVPVRTFKRHIDLVISQEINAPQFFREKIYHQGRSLEETLDMYYKMVQEVTGIPVVLEGADVLLTAVRLQDKFLKTKDNTIVIYGSFVNGKAYAKSSDLDFAVINPKLETQMRETDLLGILTDFPLSEAQAHTINASQVHSLGSMNPLVLIIRKDYIVLRVYENGLHKDFSQRNVKFDEFYF